MMGDNATDKLLEEHYKYEDKLERRIQELIKRAQTAEGKLRLCSDLLAIAERKLKNG